MEEPSERVAVLETRMNRVEEGVANFRGFQQEARDFFMESRTRAATEKLFHETRDREIKEALQASNDKLNRNISRRSLLWQVVGVFVAIMAVAVSVAAVCATLYIAEHTEVQPIKILGDEYTAPALSWFRSQPLISGGATGTR